MPLCPYVKDADFTLYNGDCLGVLRTLPDRSVDMVATSPPFYGLRDYGTGTWEGGDPDCNHAKGQFREFGDRRASTLDGGVAIIAAQERADVYRKICSKCGAVRIDSQIGLEETPDEWVARLVEVFREVRRVLRDHGTLWVEIGDSYAGGGAAGTRPDPNAKQMTNRGSAMLVGKANPIPAGSKPKDLLGQPWMLAFALRADGWYLRSEIIWSRPNPMPESVTDRPTKAHSTVFLLSKRSRYFYDADAIREAYKPDGRLVTTVVGGENSEQHRNGERWPYPSGANARSVWTIPTEPTPFAHFATWPQKLVARMILAGTSERGVCPECGSPWERERDISYEKADGGTTGQQRSPTEPDGRTNGTGQAGKQGLNKIVLTLGWRPTCSHGHQPVPATVLDPFLGSGTTALVARNLGRHSIGIELNAEYCEIAARRLQQQSLFAGEPA